MKSAKKSSLKKTKALATKKATALGIKGAKKTLKKKRVVQKAKAKVSTQPIPVGIFGGLFDPFHFGHMGSLESVLQSLKLKKIRVIPAFQSPLRHQTQGANPEHRWEMVKGCLKGKENLFVLDDREIRRGGVSYTAPTLEELKQEFPHEKLHLIVGVDQFEKFDQWFQYENILSLVDLVVTTRPGRDLPSSKDEFPEGVRRLVKKFGRKKSVLQTGRAIHFVSVDSAEVSGTEIRRRLRSGQPVHDMVPLSVAEYIKAHHLYEKLEAKIADYAQFTQQCCQWLFSKGALNIKAFDLRELNGPTEFTIIASGTSTRHTSGLAEFLGQEVKNQMGVWPQGREGAEEGRWIVLDYGSLMIHLFYDFVRQEYRLEELWQKGKPLVWSSAINHPASETSALKKPTTFPLS